MMQPYRRPKGLFRGFLALSVLLHLHLVLLTAVVLFLNPRGCDPASSVADKPMDVDLVGQDEINKALAEQNRLKLLQETQEELAKRAAEEEKKEQDLKGQVVDIAQPAEEKQPDQAKFLAEYDSRTDKETKAAPGPKLPPIRLAMAPPKLKPQPPQEQPAGGPSSGQAAQVKKEGQKQPQSGEGEQGEGKDDVRQPGEQTATADKQGQENKTEQEQPGQGMGQGTGSSRRITLKDLQPTDEQLASAVFGRGGSNDYLEDVEEGGQTLLNTRRWRYATFFNRVKRQVAENWHPDQEYRRRDPTGNVYGFRDRLTILRVRLLPDGHLKDLNVEKSCGIDFLDDEAMSAFRAAQPFPNPPPGLVDKEMKMISFRFGFLFELSHRTSFRVFRDNE